MGADFLQRVGKTLKRSWDQGRVAMAETDLTLPDMQQEEACYTSHNSETSMALLG
jgi:hypothetical protein